MPKKMLILRGNAAKAGNYPDEQGKTIAWPMGALHVWAASEYARRSGYEPMVLDVAGNPQSQHSPQTEAAVKAFRENKDQALIGFYGFSGGGYNLKHILDRLAANEPLSLHRIDRIVVLGAPNKQGGGKLYEAGLYNEVGRKAAARIRGDHAPWEPADWDVFFRTNPDQSQMPKGLPKDTSTHMFGPDVWLAGWPE